MSNHLAQETSPYLLQHAENPVDWYPWGEEALALARKLDKPILLSIGYSACHWCHVMAHESFEDAEVAALMNEHFINIKVDREERPDLDHIYQAAHSVMAGRPGGWPLTMFLTPQQQPFFGGTYFPRTARYQLPGFADLLTRVAHFYREEHGQVVQEGASMAMALQPAQLPLQQGEMTAQPLLEAMRAMSAHFDAQHGGFGGAPKFPHPSDLELCLREGAFKPDARISHMALHTLKCMAQGGVFDQLGGGFCRYSVDERWEIPHFEKMLYDNGQLLALYADAWVVSKEPLFRHVVEMTAAWLMREMQAAEGGYFSALDADSEHEEGKFYVWRPEELRAVLTPQEYDICRLHYGLDLPPNFEGAWHFRVALPLPEVAARLGMTLDECAQRLASANATLAKQRETRVRPGRDEKILASWNGLAIKGMARAARVFERPDWLQSARRANDFVRTHMWRNGRLLAVHKDGQSRFAAYLDDYAFMLDAQLELLQGEFAAGDLRWAMALAKVLLAQFRDAERGDFFFTAHDHETLIQRPKPVHDSATPSGNAVAALALSRLGHLTGESRHMQAADGVLRRYYPLMAQQPDGFASLLMLLQESLRPLPMLVLRGDVEATAPWRAALRETYSARLFGVALPTDDDGLPEPLRKPVSHKPVAWLCHGAHCLPPITQLEEFRKALQSDL
ncbi:MAG TPA: thioredoxin domain-containing protein [Gallionellaceae bacterium]